MRHQRTVRKLGRTAAHRRALLGNMATSLFRAHALVTTASKARVLRSVAERLITLGKRGDLHARRMAARRVKDETVLKKLFDEIAPQFATRPGGYTRIVKIGTRRGDGASLAKLELLIPMAVVQTDEKGKKQAARKDKEVSAPEVAKKEKKKAAAKG
ncbi:MAG: 50S ribosomal protein L17 [candidate division Zixibacteria bacterium]|nr:50S ribosomal protein L17 [candidate division Zixibacteria bacterium]